MTRSQRWRASASLNAPWRRLFAKRVVQRRVHGVSLYLPWAHALPIYSRLCSSYGRNLIVLAKALETRRSPGDPPMTVLDIGANVGDSAAQIIAATDARVLCVEGDPYWANFLRRNLGDNPRATIEEVLLTPDDRTWREVSPIRSFGTTRFAQDPGGHSSLPTLSAAALRAKHPAFDDLRLIKSDTDGFDAVLVPATAGAWAHAAPVLFFEFDPPLARAAGNSEPNAMWDELGDLGYSRLAVWDNAGGALGQIDIAEAARWAATLEPPPVHLGYHYWDVVACRTDDHDGIAAIDHLMPERFSIEGTRL